MRTLNLRGQSLVRELCVYIKPGQRADRIRYRREMANSAELRRSDQQLTNERHTSHCPRWMFCAAEQLWWSDAYTPHICEHEILYLFRYCMQYYMHIHSQCVCTNAGTSYIWFVSQHVLFIFPIRSFWILTAFLWGNQNFTRFQKV